MKKIFLRMKTQLKMKLQKSNFHNTNRSKKALHTICNAFLFSPFPNLSEGRGDGMESAGISIGISPSPYGRGAGVREQCGNM